MRFVIHGLTSIRLRATTNIFAGLELDRHAEDRDDVAWAQAQVEDRRSRYLLLSEDPRAGHRALVTAAGDRLRLLGSVEQRALLPQAQATYLGEDGDGPLFSIRVDAPAGARVASELAARDLDLRSAGVALPAFDGSLFAYARALAHWQARTGYCSVCGAVLDLLALGHRARCSNPACATEHFPRVDPAIIVIVGWRDSCLLGRQSSWHPTRWSTLAGFVEPGESIEDAVRREVQEESGVVVGECRYHSSQPWPFPSALMLGFEASAIDPAIRVGRELADARWFSVGELVDGIVAGDLSVSPPLSISHALIAHWLHGHGVDLAAITPPAAHA